MKILAISLATLILAMPAYAQRGGTRIQGRAAATGAGAAGARAGTLVDAQGRPVLHHTTAADRAGAVRTQLVGDGGRWATEAELIYRYDTSEANLRRAREALDRARAAFIVHCTDTANQVLADCEAQARVIEAYSERSNFNTQNNLFRADLHRASLHLQRIQRDVDLVRQDMGRLGDATRAEIDEGLRAFRSAYNRARHMCSDAGALDAIRSANNLVIATLALQGVGVMGNVVGFQGTRREGTETGNSGSQLQRRMGAGVGAVGNVGATITSLVARDAFLRAIYRIDDCQRAIEQLTDLLAVVPCPDGFTRRGDNGQCEWGDYAGSDGAWVAGAALNPSCNPGWRYDAGNCVFTGPESEGLDGQPSPRPQCPPGTRPNAATPVRCVPIPVDAAEVTALSAGIHRIWQGSRARDSVEACNRVVTGTSRDVNNRGVSMWRPFWGFADDYNGVPLQYLANNMLYGGVMSSIAAVINVGSAMGQQGGGVVAHSLAGLTGGLAAVGFTLPVLMQSGLMLHNAERCLEAWPETVDEQW